MCSLMGFVLLLYIITLMELEAMKRQTNVQNGSPPAPGLLFRLFHDSGSFPVDPLSKTLMTPE